MYFLCEVSYAFSFIYTFLFFMWVHGACTSYYKRYPNQGYANSQKRDCNALKNLCKITLAIQKDLKRVYLSFTCALVACVMGFICIFSWISIEFSHGLHALQKSFHVANTFHTWSLVPILNKLWVSVHSLLLNASYGNRFHLLFFLSIWYNLLNSSTHQCLVECWKISLLEYSSSLCLIVLQLNWYRIVP